MKALLLIVLTVILVPVHAVELKLPEGFQARLLAEKVGAARHLAVRENGDIFVRLQDTEHGGGIVALRDKDGDGRYEVRRYFSDTVGTGIQIHKDWLYFSDLKGVYRYALDAESLVPSGSPQVIVKDLPEQFGHRARGIVINDDEDLFVGIGAPSNACQESPRTKGSPGKKPCPELNRQGSVWKFSASRQNQTQTQGGSKFATGLRHTIALAWNSATHSLYAVQHGRDQLHSLFPEHYSRKTSAEQPAEELLKLTQGYVGGWPYTYWDWQKRKRMLAPEYGGDGEKAATEDKYPEPIHAFPGHYAPNDLIFYEANHFPEKYRGGAFVAFHGSWNRAPFPQKGYQVAFLAFTKGQVKGPHETFADGFKGAAEISGPGEAQHRPCGLAVGPQGALYVADSRGGNIWKISYKGE